MSLIKTRPKVRLLLARPLVAGEIGEFIIELHCSKPVPVDGVRLTLFGDLIFIHTSQYGRNRSASRFLEHGVERCHAIGGARIRLTGDAVVAIGFTHRRRDAPIPAATSAAPTARPVLVHT